MLFRLADIRKSFGGTEILRGVSFQVNPGEKVGLVGRNGAGKTTAFRIITGQESPDSGDLVKINGLRLGLLDQHVDFGGGETVHTAALSAFKEVHDIEARMRELEKLMETDHSATVLDEYADLQSAFEQADGFTYAARAEAILFGLGFTTEMWSMDTAKLSGGQKNRLGMARLLLSASDVLLLDEPTNHLDVSAVEWLEEFLRESDKPYVVVSHDRYFLDRTTNRIVELESGKAVTYKGNYSEYLKERELRREQQQREYENQQAVISKTQDFIRKNLAGQKTKQAKSRRIMLERMDKIEALPSEKSGGQFGLKRVERTGNNVLTTDKLKIGYRENVLGDNINFSLLRGEALGIIGPNGTGKTTLLKTLLGDVAPLDGEILWGTKVNVGYYAQNLEELEPRNEVIQELRRVAPMADNGELRSFLARFLFMGDDVFKKVSDLSGGEKGRLALAKLIYSRKNILILDEPTNHLDIPAREALEDALAEYDGTIITVSHDRFFLDKIVSRIVAFEVGAKVRVYNGNYTEYHDWLTEKRRSAATSGGNDARRDRLEPEAPTEADPTRTELSKNQREQIEKRISAIEAEIPRLEDELREVQTEMGAPDIAADFTRLRKAQGRHDKLEAQIKDLYAEWETITEKL
ncbi:MAG: ABC-F family ATP-binding cassette domain-containing protein [Blastocatellia bacterium]|nr:ABC-F family ATP-binding cassette domain-containing protein [Blastocatellia bacterium]